MGCDVIGIISALSESLDVSEESIIEALKIELDEYDYRVIKNKKRYTNRELLKAFKTKYYELNRVPKWSEIDNDFMMPSSSTYLLRFKNKRKVCKLCGIDWRD